MQSNSSPALTSGAEANRATLDAVLRQDAEQGFTSRPLELDEVWLPSTLTDVKV